MDRMEPMNRLDKVRKGLQNADDLELPMSDDFLSVCMTRSWQRSSKRRSPLLQGS